MNHIEAMKQALEALEYADEMIDTACVPKAITNLRIAIEQAEKIEPVMGTKTWYEDGKVITQNLYPSDVYKQEKQDVEQSSTESKETFDQPVAWIVDNERGVIAPQPQEFVCSTGLCHYTQPQREWVGLTDEEIKHAPHHMVDGAYHYSFKQGAVWAEAKLRSKNA